MIKPLDKMTINVGDTIYIKKAITYGWNNEFRHHRYEQTIVTRVTPKRNTIETTSGIIDRNTDVYGYSEELAKSNTLAYIMNKIKNTIYRLYERYKDGTLFTKIPDEILQRTEGVLRTAEFLIAYGENIKTFPTFDVLLIEVPGAKGLTHKEIQMLTSFMPDEEYYPVEFSSHVESCAMGFLSAKLAAACEYDYSNIETFVADILDNSHTDAGIYKTETYTVLLIKDIHQIESKTIHISES